MNHLGTFISRPAVSHAFTVRSQSMVQFCSQLEAMQNLKEQLEQRTRMIEANIQRQQDELRQIQEELQRVQGQSLQVRPNVLNSPNTAHSSSQVLVGGRNICDCDFGSKQTCLSSNKVPVQMFNCFLVYCLMF